MVILKLSDGFTIKAKETSAILTQETQRLEINPDTLEEEIFTHKENWYFVTLSQALNRYVTLVLLPCADVKQVAERLVRLEEIIKGIK